MEQHSGFNAVDLAVVATILISGALALWRGLVRELLSLAAWTGAAFAAVYFYPTLRPWMHEHIKNDFGADVASGFAVFCIALLILLPLAYFVSGLVRGKALTAIDRSLGFLFGIARGALIVSLLFFVTLWVWPEKEKEPALLAQAKTRPLLASGADVMKDFLPQEEMKKMTERMNALEKPHSDKQPPLDQEPSPTNVTTTVSTKTDAVPDTKPSAQQVLDKAPSPTDKPAEKP
jgi:membrane protein required for colicin V production